MPVILAVVANFIFGFIWYTPLFGRTWAKEMGFNFDAKPPAGAMAKGLVLMVVGSFFMAYVRTILRSGIPSPGDRRQP
ncbi:MAG: DUF1761 domain-containing protein [Bacteroidota bacterium]